MCQETGDLNVLKVDHLNNIYRNLNEKIVISKSDKKNDMYDILFFVSRDIEYIQIPSFIKIIAPFALEGSCSSFIEFSEDSNLEIIYQLVLPFLNVSLQLIKELFVDVMNLNSLKFLKIQNFKKLVKKLSKELKLKELKYHQIWFNLKVDGVMIWII